MVLVLAATASVDSEVETAKLIVSDVVAEQLAFDPRTGESVTWRFRVSKPSELTVLIYDSADRLMARLMNEESVDAGDHRVTWGGFDDQGRRAPPGYYLLAIEAAAAGASVRYDPTDVTGGERINVRGARFDPIAGVVRYTINADALVRIHLGTKGGPLLRTLVDWVARSAGEQTETWDGWDEAGVIDFGRSPRLTVQVSAYSLPINAVVIRRSSSGEADAEELRSGAAGRVRPIRTRYLDFPADRPTRQATRSTTQEMFNHWKHDRSTCHNPVISIAAPQGATRDETGTFVVSDSPLPLRLAMASEEAAQVQDERFELVVYLDGLFVTEEEQGYVPFTWSLPPELLTRGEHVVTFVLRGYEGHFGTASIGVRR
jgi:hypothetical protein